MARSMLWYTCCLADAPAWDLAVQPAYEGTIYAPIDMDTFRIHKDTQHPEEAFTVLTYLLDEAALDLLTTYGGYPALPELQDAAIQAKAEAYPSVQNWDVVNTSIPLAPNPHHEAWYPGLQQGPDSLPGSPHLDPQRHRWRDRPHGRAGQTAVRSAGDR